MIKFSVVESQGKVIARIDNCAMDAYNVLSKRLPAYMSIDPDAVKMKSSFKAVAKCHPEDEVNVPTGMTLAKERVIAKYNKAMAKILVNVGNDIDEYLGDIDSRIEFFED